jgi:hypothetical protein
MVVGSIWLLRTGIIELSEKGKNRGGLDVEIKDKLKISTASSSVSLFIIGLAFLVGGLWFSQAPPPLNLVGKIQIDKPSLVTVSVQYADSFTPDSDGLLDRQLQVDNQRFTVVVNAAGYDPPTVVKTLKMEDPRRKQLKLPEVVKFTKTSTASAPSAGTTPSPPPGVTLEPFNKN